MICCCASSNKQLVVMTFLRATIGGGSNSVVALDGTGSILWYYDTGLTSAGTAYVPGKPLIDASGNVYIPIFGLTSASGANHFSSSKLLKLDKTGALQWTYDPGDSTSLCGLSGSTQPTLMVAGAAFDSSGNIVFGRFCSSGTAFVYAVKVDTTGSHVSDYSTHGTGFGGLADGAILLGGNAGPIGCIALDSSDNVYWFETLNRSRLIKVNSSGTFQSSFIPNLSAGTAGTDRTAGVANSLVSDQANSKLFVGINSAVVVGDGSTKYSTGSKLVQKIDMAGMSTDWSFPISSLTGATLNTTPPNTVLNVIDDGSISNNLGIAYDPTVLRVFFASGTVADTVPSAISNFASCQSGTTPNLGYINVMDATVSHKGFGVACAVDTTTDDVFSVCESTAPAGGGTFAAVRKMDPASGVNVWTAITTSGIRPVGIAAATYT